jgi:hypothetical protein
MQSLGWFWLVLVGFGWSGLVSVGLYWFAIVWDVLYRVGYCNVNIVLFVLGLDKFGNSWKGLKRFHIGSTRVCQTLKKHSHQQPCIAGRIWGKTNFRIYFEIYVMFLTQKL